MSEISLRSYQTEACDRIESELQSVKSTLLVLPTGVGKTITFAELARRYSERGQRVLILAHRDELISQAVDKVSRIVNPDLITVEKANQVADQGLRLKLHHPVIHQEKQVCISHGIGTPDSRGYKVKAHKL